MASVMDHPAVHWPCRPAESAATFQGPSQRHERIAWSQGRNGLGCLCPRPLAPGDRASLAVRSFLAGEAAPIRLCACPAGIRAV